MPDFIFDGPNKIMKEPPGTGDTSFDVARDLYSAWKRWVQSDVGSRFEEAFIPEGGTPIGATGSFTGSTFLLTNGWKVMGADHDHQVILNGNLFSDDGIVSVANPVSNVSVFVSASVNAQGVATGGVQQSTLETIQNLVNELHRWRGLNASFPLVVDTTQMASGDIIATITTDGDEVTVARQ